MVLNTSIVSSYIINVTNEIPQFLGDMQLCSCWNCSIHLLKCSHFLYNSSFDRPANTVCQTGATGGATTTAAGGWGYSMYADCLDTHRWCTVIQCCHFHNSLQYQKCSWHVCCFFSQTGLAKVANSCFLKRGLMSVSWVYMYSAWSIETISMYMHIHFLQEENTKINERLSTLLIAYNNIVSFPSCVILY